MNSYGFVECMPNEALIINEMHLIKLRSSYGLAAFILGKATIMHRMHLTRPWKFLWHGCIHSQKGFNNNQDASREDKLIQMVILWLSCIHDK